MTQPDNKALLAFLARHEQLGIVLNPEILEFYKGIDAALPVLIVQKIDEQLKREYRYAIGGQMVAAMALILLTVGFVFLVMNGHENPAYVLLGAGVLNAVGGFLRARLNNGKDRGKDAR